MHLPLNKRYLENLLSYRKFTLEYAGNDQSLYLNHMFNFRKSCAKYAKDDMEKGCC